MDFVEQLIEKAMKDSDTYVSYASCKNIVKLCVDETAKEILKSQNDSISSNSSWLLMNNKCQDLITQAEQTDGN
jgi:hypothetical protein